MVRRKVKIPHEDGTIEEIEINPDVLIDEDDASYEADSKIAEIEKRLDDLESAVKELALIIKKILHGREYT